MNARTQLKQEPVGAPRATATFRDVRKVSRAARRLASRTSAITVWWDRLPTPRPNYLTPATLAMSLGYPIRRMGGALRWLGWIRTVRRIRGKQAALWVPPSSTLKPRPRGRPRIYHP